jgi:hypothetical protein
MRSFSVAVALLLSGCGFDCAPSGNIQVTVTAGPGLDVGRVATLRIVLSVDGMQPKTLDVTLKSPLTSMPKTLLLQPDPPPANRYNVALSVQALDASGAVFALGTASSDVAANGCNRLEASLFPLGAGGGDGGNGRDGFIPPDLMSTDMSNCTVVSASVPDEDQDNLADSCDLCPDDSDPTPVDSDLDGLPDACDPDPALPSNTLLYFDPFNADSGNWSGNFDLRPFPQGYWSINTQGTQALASGNTQVMLPSNVRIQAHVLSPGIYVPGSVVNSDFGLFLGNSPNPGLTSTSGVLCIANATNQQPNDQLTLLVVQNGSLGQATSTPIPNANAPNGWHTDLVYRLRLTQRGAVYTCELVAVGGTPVTVTKTLPSAPSAPQFMALHAQAIEAHFYAVVAESVLP